MAGPFFSIIPSQPPCFSLLVVILCFRFKYTLQQSVCVSHVGYSFFLYNVRYMLKIHLLSTYRPDRCLRLGSTGSHTHTQTKHQNTHKHSYKLFEIKQKNSCTTVKILSEKTKQNAIIHLRVSLFNFYVFLFILSCCCIYSCNMFV